MSASIMEYTDIMTDRIERCPIALMAQTVGGVCESCGHNTLAHNFVDGVCEVCQILHDMKKALESLG